MSPLVSVYIPTYNRSSLVKRAVESVKNQTYKNIEVIVVDDGSGDDTEAIVKSLVGGETAVRFYKNENAKGACGCRNTAIKYAQGEYITGLDDDDEFTPDRIDTFVTFFEKNRYPYISSGIVFRGDKGDFIEFDKAGVITLEDLCQSNVIGNQVFTTTENLREIGGFDNASPAWQDYDTWLRLAAKFGNGYRIGGATYIQYLDHGFNRITKSKKLRNGYEFFINKHAALLNEKAIKTLYFQYKLAAEEKLSFSELLTLTDTRVFLGATKYYLKGLLQK